MTNDVTNDSNEVLTELNRSGDALAGSNTKSGGGALAGGNVRRTVCHRSAGTTVASVTATWSGATAPTVHSVAGTASTWRAPVATIRGGPRRCGAPGSAQRTVTWAAGVTSTTSVPVAVATGTRDGSYGAIRAVNSATAAAS